MPRAVRGEHHNLFDIKNFVLYTQRQKLTVELFYVRRGVKFE